MAQVRTYSQLLRELERARNRALMGASKKAEQLVKDKIDSDVYGTYSSEGYSRTYQLRESVEASNVEVVGNKAVVFIEHNESKITSSGNQHRSVVDGYSSASVIANIVHNGFTGAIGQSGYWKSAPWSKPEHTYANARPYMDNAKMEMQNGKYRKFMIEQLRGQGYTVR